ncbi:MAG: helix-turn-helix domain-containing protein, partial [Acetobacterium sp.]|nr:helix-turn-helix domain-containing protein [Acetobacterium sp.]
MHLPEGLEEIKGNSYGDPVALWYNEREHDARGGMQAIEYYRIIRGEDKTMKCELRHSMVMLARGKGVKPAARFYGVSKNTVRKWLRRYEAGGVAGLEERSRAPRHCPHKTDAVTEQQIIAIKRKLKKFGSKRLKRDFDIPCGHGAITRISREHNLHIRRKTKRHRRNDLRAEKAKYRAFERTCNDTKYLNDIPEYWTQTKKHDLPWFQYSHRDVRTGAMFLGFARELSLTHATDFAQCLVQWYQEHGISLSGAIWSFDGGSEYIGSWQAKEPSSYRRALRAADINDFQIPKTTYNAEVETIHHTIEFEHFELETFSSRPDFFSKTSSYQWWYNCGRKNGYRNDKSPKDILEEIAPEIDPKILLLPVIDLDQVLQNRVSSLVPNLFTGGHHVPGHA